MLQSLAKLLVGLEDNHIYCGLFCVHLKELKEKLFISDTGSPVTMSGVAEWKSHVICFCHSIHSYGLHKCHKVIFYSTLNLVNLLVSTICCGVCTNTLDISKAANKQHDSSKQAPGISTHTFNTRYSTVKCKC